MAIKPTADGFFSFFDKYLVQIMLLVGGFILYRSIKSTIPTDDERKTGDENGQRKDVNERLIPPPVPKKDADGQISKSDEQAYNVANKAHRSASFATKLLTYLRTNFGGLITADNSSKIMAVSFQLAIARIGLAQISADYLAAQPASGLWNGERTNLLDDLKFFLSSSNYLLFMQRMGLTPAQAYAASHPPLHSKK